MGIYQVEIEIPDGDYCVCFNNSPGKLCQFLTDYATGNAGQCTLIKDNPLLSYQGGNPKDVSYYNVIKHKDCPSKLQTANSRR